jgi:hypothetical protein
MVAFLGVISVDGCRIGVNSTRPSGPPCRALSKSPAGGCYRTQPTSAAVIVCVGPRRKSSASPMPQEG